MDVGNTPLVEVDGIYAKLECTNPCGSIKDRIACYILDKSEENGSLEPGMTIVEATSGNTGIAFTWYARQKGYEITIVMPENMSEERKRIIRALGAKLVLCSKEGSFAEAAAIRDELAKKPGYFNPDQFSNPLNVECHRVTTGSELLQQVAELGCQRIDALAAGVGTGGTLVGLGQAIRERFPEARIAAVEPTESAVMSGGCAGPHDIQGIGDGFVPAIASDGAEGLHPIIDEVIVISSQEAIATAQDLRKRHGLCVGISSGANYLAAQVLRARLGTQGGAVVTVFADGYFKYQTHGLVHCDTGACQHENFFVDQIVAIAKGERDSLDLEPTAPLC